MTQIVNTIKEYSIKYDKIFLLCFFLLQVVFFSYKIGEISLWYDESFSIYCAVKSIPGILEVSKADVNPPLYAIVLHYWVILFGDSEYSIRMLSAICMSLANVLLYKFSIKFFNFQTAVFTCLIFLSSYPIFYYAQEARTYALVILAVVGSNYLFFELIKPSGKKKTIFYSLALGVSYGILFYLHFLSCFLVLGHLFTFFINSFSISKKEFNISLIKNYLYSGIVFVILVLPFSYRFFSLVKTGDKIMWLKSPSMIEFKKTLFDFFNNEIIFTIYLITFIVVLIFVLLFKKSRLKFDVILFLFTVFSGITIFCLNYYIASYSPIFLLRYVLFSFIGIALMIAYVFSLLNIKFILKLPLFMALVIYSFVFFKVPKEIIHDFKHAVKYLSSKKTAQTLIVTDLVDAYTYYGDREIFYLENDDEKTREALKKNIYTYKYNLDWPEKFDFSKYKYIYYSQSYSYLNDPNSIVLLQLNKKLNFIKNINNYKGVFIKLYENPNYK